MYAREVGGEELSFGVSGKLIRNVLVMYDRQTDSLWSQLLGEAIKGELQGTKLEYLPSWHTTWEQWKQMHPNTIALEKGSGSRDPYASYYASTSPGVIGETIDDDRLQTKEFVIGVELDVGAIAYPFSVLSRTPIINDNVFGLPILVVFDPETGSGQVYERQHDAQPLTFIRSLEDPARLVDEETGSSWDAFSGVVVEGPLSGSALKPVKSTAVFWFGGKDFHPDTLVYTIAE